MIIRSQDKTKITTDLNLEIITNDTVVYTSFEDIVNGNVKESNSKISAIHDSSGVLLGKYSTEEKALKVLDMIQATYERNKLFAITYKDGVLQRLEKCNGLEGTRELIGSVFQMPSDESVEV